MTYPAVIQNTEVHLYITNKEKLNTHHKEERSSCEQTH